MFGLGMGEILVIAVVLIVIFGASRLPKLGRGLGEGITNFKKGLAEGGKSAEEADNDA